MTKSRYLVELPIDAKCQVILEADGDADETEVLDMAMDAVKASMPACTLMALCDAQVEGGDADLDAFAKAAAEATLAPKTACSLAALIDKTNALTMGPVTVENDDVTFPQVTILPVARPFVTDVLASESYARNIIASFMDEEIEEIVEKKGSDDPDAAYDEIMDDIIESMRKDNALGHALASAMFDGSHAASLLQGLIDDIICDLARTRLKERESDGKTFDYEAFDDESIEVRLVRGTYMTGGLYVALLCRDEDGEGWEPYCDVTVNLSENGGDETFACVDTNNAPRICRFLEKNGLAKPTGLVRNSGFCSYPVYRFTPKFFEVSSRM